MDAARTRRAFKERKEEENVKKHGTENIIELPSVGFFSLNSIFNQSLPCEQCN
jgi:hypothetical protein